MVPPSAGRAEFHPLTVARVDPLTDDSAAVTFDVPPGLADRFAFAPGQSLTIRRGDERRSYSICAVAGRPPRIGVREVAGGAVSGWLVHEVRAGDVIDVQAPSGSFTPDLDIPGAPRPDRRGQRDHARLVHRRIRARRAGQVRRHPALRQPAQRLGDVRRRDRRPQGRLPGADLPGPRAQPRAAGSRAVQRPARRRQAALAAAGHRRRSRGGPLVAVRPVRHGRRRDRGAGRARRPARPHPPRAVLRRGRAARRRPRHAEAPAGPGRRGDRAARRPQQHRDRPGRAPRSWTGPSGSAPTCRSPARAGCAAPAAPGWSRARSPCAATTPWSRTELDAGYILTCQSLPASEHVTVDYDA